MKSQTRAAFSLTVAACVAFFIGWVIPFWFGRWYEKSRSKMQWGLFYLILCKPGRCTNVAGILDKDNVDFGGAESPVELQAIAVLATLAFGMCLVSLLAVLIFHCHVCGQSYSYHMYVIGAAILQLVTALLGLVTIVLEAVCIAYFFQYTSLESVIEFPWALLCYCIGEILIVSSAVIYLLIAFRWKKYRRIYARQRYPIDNKTTRLEPPADYEANLDRRYKTYDRDSFVGYYRDNSADRYQRSSSRDHLPGHDFLSTRDRYMYRPYYTLPGRRSAGLVTAGNKVYSGGNYLPYATVRREYPGASRTLDGGHRAGRFDRVWYTTDGWVDPAELAYEMRGRDVYM